MEIKSKIKWFLLSTLIIFVAVYIAFSIWMASSVRYVMESACKTNGVYSSEFSKYATPKMFSMLNVRDGYPSYSDKQITDKYSLSKGRALHNFLRGIVWINYSYEGRDNETGKILFGSWGVPVRITVELKNGSWYILSIHEDP